MTLTRKTLVLLATAGSAALMLGALGFQFIGEMPPCKLCWWQRYGHLLAIGAGAVALVWKPKAPLVLLGLLGALATSLIGFYHAGVEQKWWEGPTTCTSGSIAGLTPEELLAQIQAAPLVRCDEIPWEMLGVSMAGWNAIVSLGLAAFWLMALKKS